MEIWNAQLFTIMTGESAGVFNEDQVVIYLQWVDANLQPHEEFIGLKPIAYCDAEQIFDVIKVKQTI